jgi:hypothetical protein
MPIHESQVAMLDVPAASPWRVEGIASVGQWRYSNSG